MNYFLKPVILHYASNEKAENIIFYIIIKFVLSRRIFLNLIGPTFKMYKMSEQIFTVCVYI